MMAAKRPKLRAESGKVTHDAYSKFELFLGWVDYLNKEKDINKQISIIILINMGSAKLSIERLFFLICECLFDPPAPGCKGERKKNLLFSGHVR